MLGTERRNFKLNGAKEISLLAKWRAKIRLFFDELKKPPNVLIAVLTAIFTIIWGSNWQYSSYQSWWFDTLGHIVAGFGGALSLRYLIRKYGAKGFFAFDEGRRFLAIIVEAWVIRLAILWEVIEFVWDVLGQPNMSWMARAQKDLIDTMVDIIAAVFFAKIAMILASGYDHIYENRYPDEIEREEMDEVIGMVARVSQSKKLRRRALRRQRIERAIGFLRDELDKIGDKFKDDKDEEN